MRFAIDLDRQLRVRAIEVEDITRDRMLTAELDPIGRTTQPLPQQCFGQAHRLTQATGLRYGRGPSTTLRVVPLPMPCMGRNREGDTPAHRLPSTSSASNRWIAAGSALRLTFSVIGVAAPVTHSVRSLSRSNVPALSTAKRVIDR